MDFRHISSSSATHSGERMVLSPSVSFSLSLLRMREIALSTGTLVKREDTSKLTRISSLSTCTLPIISVMCLEFLTWELVCPARGDMKDVMYGKLVILCTKQCIHMSQQDGVMECGSISLLQCAS